MVWSVVPNNPNWEYDNAPVNPGVDSPYYFLWAKQVGGIRTNHGYSVYTTCRRKRNINQTENFSELSKTYWDNYNP